MRSSVRKKEMGEEGREGWEGWRKEIIRMGRKEWKGRKEDWEGVNGGIGKELQ